MGFCKKLRLNCIKWGQIWPNWTKQGQAGKDLLNRVYQVKQGQTWPNGVKLGQAGPIGVTILGLGGEYPWVGG